MHHCVIAKLLLAQAPVACTPSNSQLGAYFWFAFVIVIVTEPYHVCFRHVMCVCHSHVCFMRVMMQATKTLTANANWQLKAH